MRSFGILLVCVVLQTKKNGLPPTEVLVEQGYGLCQLLLTIAVLPVTLWVIRKRMLELREQARDHLDQLTGGSDDDDNDHETVVKNPLTDTDDVEG